MPLVTQSMHLQNSKLSVKSLNRMLVGLSFGAADPWQGVQFSSAAEVGADFDYRCGIIVVLVQRLVLSGHAASDCIVLTSLCLQRCTCRPYAVYERSLCKVLLLLVLPLRKQIKRPFIPGALRTCPSRFGQEEEKASMKEESSGQLQM
jgi:hypothetical protein